MPQDATKAQSREKRTITEIRESKKSGEKMVYMSVPDYTSARWAEMAGVDVAVVGDSLAMVAHGHPSTIPATMDMMVMHAQAVRRGAPLALVAADMPFGSYHGSVARAVRNVCRMVQLSGADCVKLEAAESQLPAIRELADAGVAVIAHLGLRP